MVEPEKLEGPDGLGEIRGASGRNLRFAEAAYRACVLRGQQQSCRLVESLTARLLASTEAITDEPYDSISHVRVRGGRREQSRPLPGNEPGDDVSMSC